MPGIFAFRLPRECLVFFLLLLSRKHWKYFSYFRFSFLFARNETRQAFVQPIFLSKYIYIYTHIHTVLSSSSSVCICASLTLFMRTFNMEWLL